MLRKTSFPKLRKSLIFDSFGFSLSLLSANCLLPLHYSKCFLSRTSCTCFHYGRNQAVPCFQAMPVYHLLSGLPPLSYMDLLQYAFFPLCQGTQQSPL